MFSAMLTAPQETIVTCKWFVHKDAREGVDYTVEGLTKLWIETNLQDRDLAEKCEYVLQSAVSHANPTSNALRDWVAVVDPKISRGLR